MNTKWGNHTGAVMLADKEKIHKNTWKKWKRLDMKWVAPDAKNEQDLNECLNIQWVRETSNLCKSVGTKFRVIYWKFGVKSTFPWSFLNSNQFFHAEMHLQIKCTPVPILSTPPATLRLVEKFWTIVLTTKCQPLKHSDLCRVLSWIKDFTLARFHSIRYIWQLI